MLGSHFLGTPLREECRHQEFVGISLFALQASQDGVDADSYFVKSVVSKGGYVPGGRVTIFGMGWAASIKPRLGPTGLEP